MKNLIQLIESIRILFIRSNLQTRTALVLCILLLSVGVGLIVQNANLFSNRMEYLLDGQDFEPLQLDQFELAFSNSGLRHYQRVGKRMRIPSSSKDAYLKALGQAKCLTIHSQHSNDTHQDPLRFLEPRTVAQERERKERIRQIENTLKEFPFVRQAVVTYNERNEGFVAEKKRAATVSIHPKNKPQLTRSERRSIIRLVHMHFPGLKAAEVALVDLGIGETFTEPILDSQDVGPIAQSDHLWTDRRREHEEEVKKKAMELLEGYGDVQIVVTSEPIGTESLNQTSHNNDQETQVSPQSPTTLPNRKARLQDPESPKAMLQQRCVYTNRISISVPTSYYHKAYQLNGHANQQSSSSAMQDNSAVPSLAVVTANPTSPTEQALENIKTRTAQTIREKLSPLVATSSIGASEKENRIVITEHLDSIDSANNIQPTWQNLVDWLRESWKTLGLFAIVMIAMLLLKSITPSPRVNEIVDRSKQASGLSLIDLQENPDSVQQDKPLAKSSVILSKKIQSQPEQVASRLASWISQN
jgi:flagellar biosynthesis/type III secretory pathway M-ring protein FliF/YscJ